MRVTEKQLQAAVDRLNEATGSPVEYRNDKGESNIGHFCLDYAYGGVSLDRITNTGGGVTDRYCYGRHTKGELFALIDAMIQGVYLGKS